MKWIKKGQIFTADNNYEWMSSHAANPVAEYIGGDQFRVYFSCRDRFNRSSIGFVEIDIRHPKRILRISDVPVVCSGSLGTFDDSGTSMGCIVQADGKKYLYFLGWNLGVTVPWRNSIGLAISEINNDRFKKYSQAPIVDRNKIDPYSLSYPWVMKQGMTWKMWYGSNLSWGSEQKDMQHLLKYAESEDGIHWNRNGVVAISFKSSDEYAMSKPCVIRDDDLYKMWFSYRGQSYRIGYAESQDGKTRIRKDEIVGIDVSESGWDAQTIEYPNVFEHGGERYMLYNGNSYGKTGFGLAILEEN